MKDRAFIQELQKKLLKASTDTANPRRLKLIYSLSSVIAMVSDEFEDSPLLRPYDGSFD